MQFIERSIEAPSSLHFDVFFVQSANRLNLSDIQHGKDVLGYEPLDGFQD